MLQLLGRGKVDFSEFKIESNLHDNSIVFEIENVRHDLAPHGFAINIKTSKEDFFEKLKENKYFLEQYDEETMVFYKNKENNSCYFVIQKMGDIYQCTDTDIDISGTYYIIDFPFYVLEHWQATLSQDLKIKCNFEYIKSFYQKMAYIVEEEGEDYILIKSGYRYMAGQTPAASLIRIDKTSEDTIIFTEVLRE